jgi:hypothetical protein
LANAAIERIAAAVATSRSSTGRVAYPKIRWVLIKIFDLRPMSAKGSRSQFGDAASVRWKRRLPHWASELAS